MFRFVLLLACVFYALLVGCSSPQSVASPKPSKWLVDSTAVDDSIEYRLIVTDGGFDTYLSSLAYSKDYYSDGYYRQWNIRYVAEWNYRCGNPLKYGSFYENPINYEALINYGLDFNYRLYHYFLFFEKSYRQVLIRRGSNY
jgi:hypothetical protein